MDRAQEIVATAACVERVVHNVEHDTGHRLGREAQAQLRDWARRLLRDGWCERLIVHEGTARNVAGVRNGLHRAG